MENTPSPTEARFYVFPDQPEPDAPPRSNPVKLVDPPEWRRFQGKVIERPAPPPVERGAGFQRRPEVARKVNAALALRRPLLVTGFPGCGKTTLAYAIARELGFGAVLRWNITSRSTLRDALYQYDVLGRLNKANLQAPTDPAPPIDDFLRLGPLGTALLPTAHPRVLLIDELDKSDIDLPNDLLHIFEEGYFEIPELQREATDDKARIRVADGKDRVEIEGGVVRCSAFPVVVITSNGEREFSPAFLRRCVRLSIPEPNANELAAIAGAMGVGDSDAERETIAERFLEQRESGLVTTDQLLNVLHLINGATARAGADVWREALIKDGLTPVMGKHGGATGS